MAASQISLRRLYRPLIDQALPDALFVHDHYGRFVEVNARACESLGYSRSELLAMSVAEIEEDFDLLTAQLEWSRFTSGSAAVLRGRQRRKDGTVFPVEVHFGLLVSGGQRLYIGVARDISGQRDLVERLRQQAMVFTSAEEGIVITDPQGRVLDANPAFERITEYPLDEVRGQNLGVIQSGRHDRSFHAAMWKAVSEEGHWEGEIWDRRKSGEIYLQWTRITAVQDDDGQVVNYVGTFVDTNRMKHADSELERQAHHDELTSLPNRQLLVSRLGHAIERAERHDRLGAVLFIDLDHFKAVNDTFGHQAGDELLQAVASRIRGRLREVDVLARLGGDEFVAVLDEIRNPDGAATVAVAIIRELGKPFPLSGGTDAHISGSVGIAIFPQDGILATQLIERADQALYEAKERRRGSYWFFDRSSAQTLTPPQWIEDSSRSTSRSPGSQ